MAKVRERIDGVVIGVLLGFEAEQPLVVFPGNPSDTALKARSLAELAPAMVGSEVALLFEGGDPGRPLIVGRIVDPAKRAPAPVVKCDDDLVRVVARRKMELRCGKAVILLEEDGRITIRGTHVTSHASATNRIRGASVNLN